MSIFTGMFKSRDKPQNSYDSPSYTYLFGQTVLSAHKLSTAIKISEELINDSAFDMTSYISREFARRMSAKEEEASRQDLSLQK